MNNSIKQRTISTYRNGVFDSSLDYLAIEEPLEISISHSHQDIVQTQKVSITMRTPGFDVELALGFLYTEAILKSFHDVEKIESDGENCISIFIRKGVELNLEKLHRNFYTTSSCGVCGKSSLESIRTISPKNDIGQPQTISKEIIISIKEKLNARQSNFAKTGGIHASALFDIEGNLIEVFEDVGRHNALDKLIGHYFLKGEVNLDRFILLLSGRASFELIQKSAMANIRNICSIGAPSSLAVELAEEFNITLVGFLKSDSFNIYHGRDSIM